MSDLHYFEVAWQPTGDATRIARPLGHGLEITRRFVKPGVVDQPPEHYDFLDHDRSTFGPSGLPILRVLSAAKLSPHAVTLMSRLSFTFLLAERVVDDLQSAGCQGLLYMPVSMAP